MLLHHQKHKVFKLTPSFSKSVLTENGSHQADSSTSTPSSQRQAEALTPCTQQNDRFVDPSGDPLQPGTVIVCNNLPFVVSNNGKIYNFMGGNMKQLYIADPSEHKFLVTSANSPSTFLSVIFSSVLGLFPRFSNMQNDTNKHKNEDKKQSATKASTIETIPTTNSNIGMNVSTSGETIQEVVVSDLANLSTDISIHHNMHDTPSLHGGLFQNSRCNEMLTHYNRVVIGSFKDFFQSVDTNNLAAVLQPLKELNFVLANRAPELAVHYNMTLEPCQISTEEVPDLVKAHLHCATAYNPEHSIRGTPCSRGNQSHQYNRQSSPLPRYNQQVHRSDAHFHPHPNRNYSNTHYHNNGKHNSSRPIRHAHNTSNRQVNASNA